VTRVAFGDAVACGDAVALGEAVACGEVAAAPAGLSARGSLWCRADGGGEDVMGSEWFLVAVQAPEMQAAMLTVAFELMARVVTPRVRLDWAMSPQDAHTIPRPGQPGDPGVPPSPIIRKRQVWVQNTGRGAAENVDVVLDRGPEHLDLWPHPSRLHADDPNGGLVVSVASLAPREYFVITMLDAAAELPTVTAVRSSEGPGAQCRAIAPRRVLTRRQAMIRQAASTAGVFAAFLGAITLVQWIG
jgi:hypothetical protein